MIDYEKIYHEQADQYELLVSHEDYQENLFPASNRIKPLVGLDVVELGAGTGRLTCMLAPVVKTIQAYDASVHMLEVAAVKLRQGGWQNWRTEVADHRELPVDDGVADLAISGWSIVYTVVGYEGTWRRDHHPRNPGYGIRDAHSTGRTDGVLCISGAGGGILLHVDSNGLCVRVFGRNESRNQFLLWRGYCRKGYRQSPCHSP